MSAKKKTRKEKIAEQKLKGVSVEKSISKNSKKQSTNKSTSSKSKKGLKSTHWIAAIASIIITSLVFSNSLKNQFVNWDDDKNFYENKNITTLTDGNFWVNTKKIFTSPVIGNYNPLTIWTFLLENKAFGLDQPFYWHLNNLLLHLFCVLLIFLISIQLNLSWKAAILVALLFGIHPLRVESVAWVTERKDVLYGVFYLTALLYYIKSIKEKKRYLVVIISCFILSLLSKIQAVVLPLSMLCVDYLLNQKISWNDVFNKWFYFLISLAMGIIGIMFLSDQGSLESNSTYPIWQRIFIGTYSYMIYLVKSIVPYRMSPLYPYPSSFPPLFYPTILMLPATLTALWWAFKKEYKAFVFGLGFFTFNIFFMLQILGAGQGFIADRFTYIAYFGLFFIFGYYFDLLIKTEKFKIPTIALFSVALSIFAFLSFNQNKVWENSGTLWTHVLKYYDNITLPYGNRANYYRDIGETQKALADYNARINLKQDEAAPFNSRARLYFNSQNPEDWKRSLQDYNKAIELEPNNAEYYTNRGAIYAKMGNVQAAITDLNKGLSINPQHSVAYLNRSLMYSMIDDVPNALKDIQSYLALNPYNADLWYESGRCKRRLKREQEAIADFSKAIQYNNQKGVFYYERCKSYLSVGRKTDALNDYNMALKLGANVDRSIEQFFN